MRELNNWETISNTNGKGCVLEVDLEYPKHLHDKHNFLPLAPKRITVNGVEKLILNLNNKTRYVIHHEAQKRTRNMGYKLLRSIKVSCLMRVPG